MARQTTALGGETYKDLTAAMEILGTQESQIWKSCPLWNTCSLVSTARADGIHTMWVYNSRMWLIVSEVCTQSSISYSYSIIRRGTLANATVPSMLSTCQKATEEQKNKWETQSQCQKRVTWEHTHWSWVLVKYNQWCLSKTDDHGPWYLTPDQQDLQRHD